MEGEGNTRVPAGRPYRGGHVKNKEKTLTDSSSSLNRDGIVLLSVEKEDVSFTHSLIQDGRTSVEFTSGKFDFTLYRALKS